MYYNFLMASVGDGKYLQLPSSVTGFLYLWHLPHRNCATLQVDLTQPAHLFARLLLPPAPSPATTIAIVLHLL
jgi:hypothetical protein